MRRKTKLHEISCNFFSCSPPLLTLVLAKNKTKISIFFAPSSPPLRAVIAPLLTHRRKGECTLGQYSALDDDDDGWFVDDDANLLLLLQYVLRFLAKEWNCLKLRRFVINFWLACQGADGWVVCWCCWSFASSPQFDESVSLMGRTTKRNFAILQQQIDNILRDCCSRYAEWVSITGGQDWGKKKCF